MASTAVLLDENGDVGRMYGAKTTPHMYLINRAGVLVYKGAIDDQPSTNKDSIPVARNYVLAALDEPLAGNSQRGAKIEPDSPGGSCGAKRSL